MDNFYDYLMLCLAIPFGVFVIGLLYYLNTEEQEQVKKRIRKYIGASGGYLINVNYQKTVSTGGQLNSGTMIFVASFNDAQGNRHITECSVSKSESSTGTLYWTVDPENLFAKQHPSPSKEQIISDLSTENERLKARIEALENNDTNKR